ncbi:MAG TPA: metal-dependent hydrolase [Polyangia bacterium]
MDFVTHTVTGAAIATSVMMAGSRGKRDSSEWTAFFCGVLASNAPDIDILDHPLGPDAEGLSYLLYHRGHTHTILVCLGLGAAVASLLALLVPRQSRPSLTHLMVIGLAGALLHLGMDATNDYGVHPFWPFSNGWVYGDFIFLFEPLILGALLPLALRTFFRDYGSGQRNRRVLAVLVVVVIALIGHLWHLVHQARWITTIGAAVSTIWILGHLLIRAYWPERHLRWLNVVPWTAVAWVWLVFFVCSRHAKAEAIAFLGKHNPGGHIVQVTTTPAAANPLCWRLVVAGTTDNQRTIEVHLGTYSLLPAVSPPESCFSPRVPASIEVLPKSPLPPEAHWSWLGTFHGSYQELAGYFENPRVRATTHALRAPFWQRSADGSVLIGDLRFDYEKDLTKYGKHRFTPGRVEPICRLPPWDPPFFKEPLAASSLGNR